MGGAKDGDEDFVYDGGAGADGAVVDGVARGVGEVVGEYAGEDGDCFWA